MNKVSYHIFSPEIIEKKMINVLKYEKFITY